MAYAHKVDTNQAQIVEALRRVGASVVDLSEVGGGCPDLAVGYRGVTHLLEVKATDGTSTPDQIEWHSRWRGRPVIIVRTVDAALRAIGALK
jgi:Holliday junction resolvase